MTLRCQHFPDNLKIGGIQKTNLFPNKQESRLNDIRQE